MLQLSNLTRFGVRWDRLLPDAYWLRHGRISDKRISAILNSGGFQFGDQWSSHYSPRKLSSLVAFCRRYHRQKTKLIYLPQACGPFENTLARDIVKPAYEYCSLFCARDRISLEHLTSAVGTDEKSALSPDFTNLLPPASTDAVANSPCGHVCIIPNTKMLTHSPPQVSSRYMAFLSALAGDVVQAGHAIVFVNHEGSNDELIIGELMDALHGHCTFNPDLTAREIKGVIKQSKMVVSSRFHGVASGLNQGVPTFCTSWSHKYPELMKDYGYGDHVLDVNDYQGAWRRVKTALAAVQTCAWAPKRNEIDEQRRRTAAMWSRVHRELF